MRERKRGEEKEGEREEKRKKGKWEKRTRKREGERKRRKEKEGERKKGEEEERDKKRGRGREGEAAIREFLEMNFLKFAATAKPPIRCHDEVTRHCRFIGAPLACLSKGPWPVRLAGIALSWRGVICM